MKKVNVYSLLAFVLMTSACSNYEPTDEQPQELVEAASVESFAPTQLSLASEAQDLKSSLRADAPRQEKRSDKKREVLKIENSARVATSEMVIPKATKKESQNLKENLGLEKPQSLVTRSSVVIKGTSFKAGSQFNAGSLSEYPVYFSDEVDPSSVNLRTITLVGEEGIKREGTVGYAGREDGAYFIPDAPLDVGHYMLFISGVKDKKGQPISDYSISFAVVPFNQN